MKQKWRFGRCFSFSIGWFFGVHLNLPGCICFWNLELRHLYDNWSMYHIDWCFHISTKPNNTLDIQIHTSWFSDVSWGSKYKPDYVGFAAVKFLLFLRALAVLVWHIILWSLPAAAKQTGSPFQIWQTGIPVDGSVVNKFSNHGDRFCPLSIWLFPFQMRFPWLINKGVILTIYRSLDDPPTTLLKLRAKAPVFYLL